MSIIAGLVFGQEPVPLSDVAGVISSKLFGATSNVSSISEQIVWNLRVPRIVLACIVGGGLSIVGVAMQALIRNPLAEPYILGISGGASAGASLFYLGFLPPIISSVLSLSVAAFAGGLLAILLVFFVARVDRQISVARLLLAGVAVSALMGAVTTFVTMMSPDPNKLRAMLFWLLGSLNGASWSTVVVPTIVVGLGTAILWILSRYLDAILLGEEPAFNLGVPVEEIKKLLIVLSALITGILVSAAGSIGFVGLVVPHIVRSFFGITHRVLIPLCFLVGAVFIVLADLASRSLLEASTFPIGVVTAICGVPFFLYLLRRKEYRFG
ncbi:MAG: iron ABC transporter permease [Rhodothermales bacterium]|nr:iron ABC transporter permease [Rhodothermales bacterium]